MKNRLAKTLENQKFFNERQEQIFILYSLNKEKLNDGGIVLNFQTFIGIRKAKLLG
jgi:hypothetical protein